MNLRATGIVEIVVVLIAMVIGAGFVYEAYQLRGLTRQGEMTVWAGSSDEEGSTSANAAAPAPAASATSVAPAASPGAVAIGNAAAGKVAFTKTCNGCHPGRSKGVGPALDADTLKQKYPLDSDIVKVIRGGKGGIMPAFDASSLSDADVQDIVAYLRSAP